jgi:hypothetical protein
MSSVIHVSVRLARTQNTPGIANGLSMNVLAYQ